jgi:hypothetical protein
VIASLPFRGKTNCLSVVFALVFALFGVAAFRYYVMGGKEEKKLAEIYQPWLSTWLSEGGPDSTLRSTKGAGILVLTIEKGGVTKVDSARMLQLPANLRASVEMGPKIVILYGVRSQQVTAEWGAGARDKYEYQYWFKVVDLTTRANSTFDEPAWRYDDSSFPDGLYKQALDYAKSQL